MDLKTLLQATEDQQKGFVYSSAIYWIAKSEEKIEKLKAQVLLSFDEYIGFMYKSSKYLLEFEERNLRELKEFKARIENGEFDNIKEEIKMKTHNKSITELKADLAHYQRMIPEAVNQKQQAEKDGRVVFAKSLENRIDFFRKQSTILKATIEKQEKEALLCQVS